MGTRIVIIADLVDPDDPRGRTYREVNRAKKHAIPLGTLVELESGARLFVVHHARDCDQTPLYHLSVDGSERLEPGAFYYPSEWSKGHGEQDLKVIRKGESNGRKVKHRVDARDL